MSRIRISTAIRGLTGLALIAGSALVAGASSEPFPEVRPATPAPVEAPATVEFVDEATPAAEVERLIRQTGGRTVTDVRLFDVYRGDQIGVREGLEIGVSRTAQWCGEGRPCGLDTFWDLFIGRDNVGDDGTTPENEPGNQLAGFDVRWTNMWFGTPMSFYGQVIGEDEAVVRLAQPGQASLGLVGLAHRLGYVTLLALQERLHVPGGED